MGALGSMPCCPGAWPRGSPPSFHAHCC